MNAPDIEDTPAPHTGRLRIESSGTIWGEPGTKIYLDGQDITRSVTAVTWHIGANENHGDAVATLTFTNVEITAEANLEPTAHREQLMHDDPDLAQQIRDGIAEAEAGKTVYLGSFAEFLDDEDAGSEP